MTNVVNLHGEKRWRAVIEYEHQNGPIVIEHFLEEISDLHNIIERGPEWSTLVRCTVTLNRDDGGGQQNASEKAKQHESHH
jgi:hypothetical protein